MDRGGILEGASNGDNVGVAGQVVHDLNFPADIIDVLLGDELTFGDGLTGVFDTGEFIGAKVSGAELALTKATTDMVEVMEILSMALEDRGGKGGVTGARHGGGVGVRVKGEGKPEEELVARR